MVNPVLNLYIVRIDEAQDPVVLDLGGNLVSVANGREGRARQVYNAVLTYNLAVDVIAEAAVYVNLEHVDDAALGLHDHDLRVLQRVLNLAVGLRHDALNLVPLVVYQPRQNVDLVDCGIGNSHCGGVVVSNAVCTVGALDYHRGTELAGVDQFLNLTVAAVVAAHEANLYKVLAACHLGLNDLLAVSSGVSQRLLGEYRLAGLDSCQNRTLVELTRGGNYNSVYVRIVDCFVEIGVNLGAGTGDLSALLCAFFKYVAYSNDACIADAVLDTLDVLTADHAAADQCDVQIFHDKAHPFKICRCTAKFKSNGLCASISGAAALLRPLKTRKEKRDCVCLFYARFAFLRMSSTTEPTMITPLTMLVMLSSTFSITRPLLITPRIRIPARTPDTRQIPPV